MGLRKHGTQQKVRAGNACTSGCRPAAFRAFTILEMVIVLAITVRCNALAEQRPYQIVITGTGFTLERASGKDAGVIGQYKLPESVEFEMASWPAEKWGKPRRHVWYFGPSGLSEPIRVMFRKGDSYFSQKYSAVTGWDQEESFMIQ